MDVVRGLGEARHYGFRVVDLRKKPSIIEAGRRIQTNQSLGFRGYGSGLQSC